MYVRTDFVHTYIAKSPNSPIYEITGPKKGETH